MMKRGCWPQFLQYRDELKSGGMKSKEYMAKALERFLGDDPEKATPVPAQRVKAAAEVGGDVLNGRVPTAVKADFAGRTASEVEVIRWVMRNLDIADIQPADCPDAGAWTLYNECRRSPMFRANFMLQVWPKILPNKAQLEEPGAGPVDGARQIEVIDQILSLAKRCGVDQLADHQSHVLEVAGSSPASATKKEDPAA